jgi:DNA-binding NtrC family response regulator
MPTPENASRAGDAPDQPLPQALHDAVSAFKRQLILQTLHRHGGNRSRAAVDLGIERTSLLRLIRELGLDGLSPAPSGRPRAPRAADAAPAPSRRSTSPQ